jgi:hypothetical protein
MQSARHSKLGSKWYNFGSDSASLAKVANETVKQVYFVKPSPG